jgi:hypothetical protein
MARRAEVKALREPVLDVLEARFGAVPKEVRVRLEAIEAREELSRLVTAAADVADPEAFREAL